MCFEQRLRGPLPTRIIAPVIALLATVPLLAPADAAAQASTAAPKVFYECYVPASGTTYRIKEPGTPQACHSRQHVEFSWTDGAGAIRESSTAGGDLAGTYPNPTVAGLQGRPLSPAAPANQQYLQFDGPSNQWKPAPLPALGGDVTGPISGSVVQRLQGRPVSNAAPGAGQVLTYDGTAQQWKPAAIPAQTQSLGGDLAGTASAATVRALQGRAVSAAAPGAGQVLTFDGAIQQWKPAALPAQTQSRLAVQYVVNTVDVPGPGSTDAAATCPAGTVLSGGGVTTSPNGDAKVRASGPVIQVFHPSDPPTTWFARVRNDDPFTNTNMTVWAICLSLAQ